MATCKFLSSPQTVSVGLSFTTTAAALNLDYYSAGQPKQGVETGPAHLIEAGLVDQLRKLEWTVEYDGPLDIAKHLLQDDPNIGKLKNPRAVSQVTEVVGQRVGEIAKKGWLPLTLGGDHSLAMGTISGTLSAYPDACVLWIDAHADINTEATTESGNMHGMPVSFLLNIGPKVNEFSWLSPSLAPNRIAYIGLRDIDKGERKILKDHKIAAFSMYEVDKYGIGKVVEMALDAINPNRDLPIHLSYDIDALDPSVAPSTGTTVRGGLTFREGHFIAEEVAATGLLVAMDIVEVNPTLEDPVSADATVAVACSIVRGALGETLL